MWRSEQRPHGSQCVRKQDRTDLTWYGDPGSILGLCAAFMTI
jgi:hypothetical protein